MLRPHRLTTLLVLAALACASAAVADVGDAPTTAAQTQPSAPGAPPSAQTVEITPSTGLAPASRPSASAAPMTSTSALAPDRADELEPPVERHMAFRHADADISHPTPAGAPARWTVVVAMLIGGLFLAAAVVGPIVRALAPREVPPAHSHDEPPGASHHHGKSGILNPEPDHGDAGQGHS